MEIQHERALPRPPEAVWRALNDPDVLCVCMPGCESVQRQREDYFVAQLCASAGPFNARVDAVIRIVDPDPPHHYTLAFEGSGRAVGRAEGRTHVTITEAGEGSRIAYRVEVTMSGRIARMGRQVVNKAAMRLMDRFFDRFAEELESAH